MKVLQINSFFTVGGSPRIMNGIYDTLIENGHQCKIAAGREKMYAPKDSFQIGNKLSIYRNALEARLLDNDGFLAKSSTRSLIKYIEKYDPDIIQLHNLHGYFIDIEILFDFLKKAEKPVVWTLHDCWALTGHCAYFDYSGCDSWRSDECRFCRNKIDYPSSYVISRSSKNYRVKQTLFEACNNLTIVTPSSWLAEQVKQSFLATKKIIVIHNGIDLQLFKPIDETNCIRAKYGITGKKIILGVAQNWSKRKGFQDYYRLAQLLGGEYQIVLVGLTEKQIKELPEGIAGIQRTNSVDELTGIYSLADVFVNLTYEDNFPTVNIEALACGTPIITYNTGGSPEAIDETCGWVVKKGDIERAADIIANTPDLDYAEAARERSLLFDRRKKYLEYMALYEKLGGGVLPTVKYLCAFPWRKTKEVRVA